MARTSFQFATPTARAMAGKKAGKLAGTVMASMLVAALSLISTHSQGQEMYRMPPPHVARVLNAAPPPSVSLNPSRTRMILLSREAMPPIADLAAPMLRLAGGRYNPLTNAPHGPRQFVSASIRDLSGGNEVKLALPENASIGNVSWSPDGSQFVLPIAQSTGTELWIGDTASGAVRQLTPPTLNAASGPVARWMPDGRRLLCRFIPEGRPPMPQQSAVPSGPVIQETLGVKAQVRTYQDLLGDSDDEAAFDWLLTAQLAMVDTASGTRSNIGTPAVYSSIDPSPSGEYIMVARYVRPYSYLVPDSFFPEVFEIWDARGTLVKELHRAGLRDQIPIEGVETGPRDFEWQETAPATLFFAEALDGGDPKNKVPFRDRVFQLNAPFTGDPSEVLKTEHRFSRLSWLAPTTTFADGAPHVMVSEYDRDRKWSRTWLHNAKEWDATPKLIWDRSINDRYNNPGSPLSVRLPNGRMAVRVDGSMIWMSGAGATPEGDRPFLDQLSLDTQVSTRLWRCDQGTYESIVDVMSDGSRFVTMYESPSEVPNLSIRTFNDPGRRALTSFEDPVPELRKIKKELIKYTRADGVELSATMYLPPDYVPGTRLPLFVWAYPLEFTDKATAGQVAATPTRFTRFGGISHLCLTLSGYAVMDAATMPVVGDPETVNDTFIEQIVMSAKAAIDKAVDMGVADRDRVAVGGHSYGAFMTANLLAHCDLFKAGIARSGAYNRTLTPFGFQGERRTYWEAVDTYTKMSPFTYANQIKAPLLMIHGQIDNNPGTFPVQSERLFAAIKGHGGVARLVMLPHESHGYAAKESAMHVQAEMLDWLNTHLAPKSTSNQNPDRE